MSKYVFGVDVGGTTVKMDFLQLREKSSTNGRSKPARRMGVRMSFLISQIP